jgi:hypothetical protein
MTTGTHITTGTPASPTSFDLLRMDRQIKRRVIRQRAWQIGAWTGLTGIGLKKGGVLGWLGAGVGLFGLVRELVLWREQRPEWRKASRERPSLRRLLRTDRSDRVDQGSADSFPASDAPSHDDH